MTFTSFVHTVSALTFLVVSLNLFFHNRHKLTLELGLLIGYCVTFTLFHTGMLFSSSFIFESDIMNGYVYAFAHAFILLGMVFLIAFATSILFPDSTIFVFVSVFFLAMASIIYMLINPPTEFIAISENIRVVELSIWNKILLQIMGFGVAFFGVGSFIYGFIIAKTKILKVKMGLFAAGFTLGVIGGPIHNFATSETVYFIADLFALAGDFVIILAIYIPMYLARKATYQFAGEERKI